MLSFFLKIWLQVDKPLKISDKEKNFADPSCVCGRRVAAKQFTTVHNYLLPYKYSNGMIKFELNNGFAESGVVNMSTPPLSG